MFDPLDDLVREHENRYMELINEHPLEAADELMYAEEIKKIRQENLDAQELLWECEGEIENLNEYITDYKADRIDPEYDDMPSSSKLLNRLKRFTKDF